MLIVKYLKKHNKLFVCEIIEKKIYLRYFIINNNTCIIQVETEFIIK